MKAISQRLAICLLAIVPMSAAASQGEVAAASLEIAGITLTDAQRKQITRQFDTPSGKDPDWHAMSLPLLDDMARLSQTAQRPSTRIRLEDMHRQLVGMLVPGDNLARDLLDAKDQLVRPVEDGVGMTERDFGWSIFLEALNRNPVDDPRDLDLPKGEPDRLLARVEEEFDKSSDGAKHFLARVDGWAVGTMAAWSVLSVEERKEAVSVVTGTAVPSQPVLEKVIGARDLLFWIAGMEIGLTPEEKAEYPELTEFLAAGHMAGGLEAAVANRDIASKGAAAAAPLLRGAHDMLFDYNMMLLFDN